MSNISPLAQFIVQSLYRPLVLGLLAVPVSACVPAAEAPPVQAQKRPAPAKPQLSVSRPVPPAPRPLPPAAGREQPPAALVERIRTLGQEFKGRVGIAVMRTDANWIVDHEGEMLFPQHSVSKLWVGLALADRIDKGTSRLSDRVLITKNDLTLFHQPIRALVDDDGYETSVADLFNRAMTESDNTANDSVLRYIGGPQTVRSFISAKGLGAIRFGPGERLFQSGIAGMPWRQEYSIGRGFEDARAKLSVETRGQAMTRYLNDPPDGAAPNAIVRALSRLHNGQLLSPEMTRLVLNTMESALTGKQRVLGGVPPGWRYGHKTGTGQSFDGLDTGYNDVGIMTAPDGTSYALAVQIRSTRAPIRDRQALMQAVAAAIAANHVR